MKKSQLRQIIREEIQKLSENEPAFQSLMDETRAMLAGEPQEMIDMYFDSVERDIQAGRTDQYFGMGVDDMIEDYNEYINDKMTM
jgi:hypothetical protein